MRCDTTVTTNTKVHETTITELVPPTCVVYDVLDLILNLVLGRDVLPRGEEDALVHLTVLDEQHVHWQYAPKVEDID